MTFDSLTFVVFLTLTFVAYWATPSWTARKALVLACSYVFYAAWNPFFVVLIIATTGFDKRFGSTRRSERHRDR